MILEKIIVGSIQANCYVLASKEGQKAIIIDPGEEEKKIKKILVKHKLEPGLVILTHGHFDHFGCADKFAVPVYIHKDDLKFLKDPRLNLSILVTGPYSLEADIRTVEDKENIILGDIELEVIHVPGHTPGGMALLVKKPVSNILFTGDTLFYQGVGRTDLPDGSTEQLLNSIKDKLLGLPSETIFYPGHGPFSTIGKEKKNNPFLE